MHYFLHWFFWTSDTAAFDTVDHSILLKRPARVARIKGTARGWFRSDFSDGFQLGHVYYVSILYAMVSQSSIGPIFAFTQ